MARTTRWNPSMSETATDRHSRTPSCNRVDEGARAAQGKREPAARRAWPTPPASRRHGYSSPTSGPITISSAVISTTQTALITSPGGSMSNIR